MTDFVSLPTRLPALVRDLLPRTVRVDLPVVAFVFFGPLLTMACTTENASSGAWDANATRNEKLARVQNLAVEATPEGVKVLTEATNDPVEEIRVEAIRALGKTGRPDTLPVLEKLARSDQRGNRLTAAWALGHVKTKDSLKILGTLLRDEDVKVRSQAVGSLSLLHDMDATLMVVEAVTREADPELRDRAMQILSDWKDRRAVPLFEQALRSETSEIRGHAAGALGSMGDPSCVPALTGALEDFDPVVRGAASLSLARLADKASLPAIRKRAETEKDPLARATMAWSVAILAGASGADHEWAIGELETILANSLDSDFARAQAAKALGDLNSCPSRQALIRAQKDRKGIVQNAVSRALTHLNC